MQSIKALVIKISLVLFKCLYNDYMSYMQSIKALVIKISLVLFKCLYNDYMSCQRYSNMVK